MKILVVEDEDLFRKTIVLTINSIYPDAEITYSATVADAQTLLSESHEVYSLIVCDFNLLDGHGDVVYQFLRKKLKQEIPFLFQTSHSLSFLIDKACYSKEMNDFYLRKPYTPSSLKHTITEIFATQEKRANVALASNYSGFRTPLFIEYNFTQCDLFIFDNGSYKKIISENTSYTIQEISSLIDNNASLIYIKSSDADLYNPSDYELSFLSRTDQKTRNFRVVFEEQFLIAKSLLKSYGINSSALSHAEDAVDSVLLQLNDIPAVTHRLITEQISTGGYLVGHSLLVSIISCSLIKAIGWDLTLMKHKIAAAAVFHDLTLTSDLAFVEVDDDRFEKLSAQEKKVYLDHPRAIANFLSYSMHHSKEVEHILLEHHEKPDGTGFPRGLNSAHIHQLSALFIVAHEVVNELYHSKFNPDLIPSLLVAIADKYSSGVFKLVSNALPLIFSIKHEEKST